MKRKRITKTYLMKEVKRRLRLSNKTVRSVIETYFDVVKELLLSGERVTIGDIGTVELVWRKRRKVFNPALSSYMEAPRRRTVKFRFFKSFKDKFLWEEGQDD